MEAIKRKKSLVEETYEILVDAICAREFLPGDRLNQNEIAARLNVSRQPVNSAIAILKAECLVEDTGRRGVVVSALDPGLFFSIYEYRLTVEPFAVRLAVQRRPADAAKEAADVMRQGRDALKSGDMRELLNADKAFHEMIYRWSRNQVIQASMRNNWNHIQRAMAEVLNDPARAQATWHEHESILSALMSDESDAAELAMREHIQTAYERNMPGFGERDAQG